ncbi:MAG TPA: prolyl oligopeptidase family serine peptidase, partial [bacterium]|nr:prolyl oligopeptidase family serine peptidase [bacterium]
MAGVRKPSEANKTFTGRKGYGHMVLDYYVDRLREIRQQRLEKLSAIKSLEEACAYREQVRQVIKQTFSPFPEKTPLNPQITGVVKTGSYLIEKVIFESRPGCLVTANLYLPRNIKEPVPGVIGCCGHSEQGKAEPRYQQFCQRLVQAGFAVLIYDPWHQGERNQYLSLPADEPTRTGLCFGHNMMAKQLELLGEFFGSWRAWDGIRALDYLVSRPEVDSSRLGLTGNSGGGTMTTWLWPLEERFTMAAPSCFVTTFLANLENELPQDGEQYPPGVIGAGLEMGDFFIARAPDPVLLLGQKYDYFDRRGLQETFEEVQRFYHIFGASEKVKLFLGHHPHGYYPENQEAMVSFFCQQAGLPEPGRVRVTVRQPEKLRATTQGQVGLSGSRPISELIRERAEKIASARPVLSDRQLVETLTNLLHLPERNLAPHYRNLRPDKISGRPVFRYAIETERNIRAILYKAAVHPERVIPLDVEEKIYLHLPHTGSAEEMNGVIWHRFLKSLRPLYLLDVRGLGESMPDSDLDFFHPYGVDYMCHGFGLMLGESYLGRRVFDVLRTLDLLGHLGAKEIHLSGRGQGALLALF